MPSVPDPPNPPGRSQFGVSYMSTTGGDPNRCTRVVFGQRREHEHLDFEVGAGENGFFQQADA
jgi:hypothetical protein